MPSYIDSLLLSKGLKEQDSPSDSGSKIDALIASRKKAPNPQPKQVVPKKTLSEVSIGGKQIVPAMRFGDELPSTKELMQSAKSNREFSTKSQPSRLEAPLTLPEPTSKQILGLGLGPIDYKNLTPESQDNVKKQVFFDKQAGMESVNRSFSDLSPTEQAITPVKFLTEYLVRLPANIALENLDSDIKLYPRDKLAQLLLGNEPIQRVSEAQDIYGEIDRQVKDKAKKLGLSDDKAKLASLTSVAIIGSILENPFVAGVGKTVKKGAKEAFERSLKEGIEKEMKRKLVQEELKFLSEETKNLLTLETKNEREAAAKRIVENIKARDSKTVVDLTTKLDSLAKQSDALDRKELSELSGRLVSNPTPRDVRVAEDVIKTFTEERPVRVKELIKSVESEETAIRSSRLTRNVNTVDEVLEGPTGAKTVKQEFRADKLSLDPEQTAQIVRRLEILGLDRRTIQTFEDVEQLALELGTDVKTLLTSTRKNLISAPEAKALADNINQQSQFIVNTQKQIQELSKDVKQKAVVEQLQRRVDLAEEQINIALQKRIVGGTEAGRTVASFRIQASKTMDTEFWLTKAQKLYGAKPLTKDTKDAIRSLISNNDQLNLAYFVSTLRNPSWSEKAVTLWKAGLLSSPKTFLANIMGNLSMATLETSKDVVALSLDVIAGLISGKRTTTISPRTIAAKFSGLVKGSVKGGKYFIGKGGFSEELIKKWDLPKQVRFKNKLIDGYVQSIFKGLNATDIAFREAAIAESLEKQAIIMAKNERLSGQAFKDKVRELIISPTNEMVVNSIDAAEYATFTNKNALANMISGARQALPEKWRPALDVIVPFSRTPTNIATRIADYSPLGFVKAVVQFARPSTRSQKTLIDNLSRAITGTGIIGFGAYLAQKGLMTGNPPTDPNKRADYYAEGKQANSIRIGNTWYQLNKISPFGNLLSLGANFEELSKTQEGFGLLASTAGAGAKGLTEQTFLRGVSGALGAVMEPERKAEIFIENTVASIVPAVIAGLGRTLDPTLKLTDGVVEGLKERVPGLRSNLPVRRDIFGEPVKVPGGRFNMIDPFSSVENNTEPVLREAKRIGVVIGLPTQSPFGFELTNEEYSKYQAVNGKIMKKVLDGLIRNEGYVKLDTSDQAALFNKAIREVRQKTRDSIVPIFMIERFGLPDDTNKEILLKVVSKLSAEEKFRNASVSKKEKIIKSVMSKF